DEPETKKSLKTKFNKTTIKQDATYLSQKPSTSKKLPKKLSRDLTSSDTSDTSDDDNKVR
ncbi:Ubiquitin carboxyl-terminal hydrolase 4, partial [Frankliniella fusca]